jgi:hypothetical protein
MNHKYTLAGLLIALAALPYLRAPGLPFISDDYLLLADARRWGPPSGWASLFQDVLYRSRATEFLITHWVARLFGERPEPLQIACIALHALNVLLVASLGRWPAVGWSVSLPAAGFFAVHEIKQEAVYWISSLPELLVFSFLLSPSTRCWQGEPLPLWFCFASPCCQRKARSPPCPLGTPCSGHMDAQPCSPSLRSRFSPRSTP